MRRLIRLLVTLALVVTAVPLLTAAGNGKGSDHAADHRRTVEFWTHARVAQAMPRDFVFDVNTGRFRPAAKPPGTPGGGNGGGKPGGGDSSLVTGADWNGNDTIEGSVGKVLFAFGDSYYVCSATVIDDGSGAANGSALIMTAAHCVFDEVNGQFADFWTFIPDYDAAPAPLSTSNTLYCDDTLYGCWSPQAIAIHEGYATAGSFNDQAVLHDYAVVRVGPGGHSGTAELDSTVTEQGVDFAPVDIDGTVSGHAFGYPAAKKWKGDRLIYCAGPIDGDPYNSDETYRMNECKLTGGSSGGSWLSPFTEGTGTGIVMSVNSYGYSGINAMHGPMFDGKTEAVYDLAKGAGGVATGS